MNSSKADPKDPTWSLRALSNPWRSTIIVLIASLAGYYSVMLPSVILGTSYVDLINPVIIVSYLIPLMLLCAIGMGLKRPLMVGAFFSGIMLIWTVWISMHGSTAPLTWFRFVVQNSAMPLCCVLLLRSITRVAEDQTR